MPINRWLPGSYGFSGAGRVTRYAAYGEAQQEQDQELQHPGSCSGSRPPAVGQVVDRLGQQVDDRQLAEQVVAERRLGLGHRVLAAPSSRPR